MAAMIVTPFARFSLGLQGWGHGRLPDRAARYWSATGHLTKWLLRASSRAAVEAAPPGRQHPELDRCQPAEGRAAAEAIPGRRYPDFDRCQPAVRRAAVGSNPGPGAVWRTNAPRS